MYECMCIYTYMYIYIYIHTRPSSAGLGVLHALDEPVDDFGPHALQQRHLGTAVSRTTANLRTKTLDFGGFDSSRILTLRY